jgi:hypothetical protein
MENTTARINRCCAYHQRDLAAVARCHVTSEKMDKNDEEVGPLSGIIFTICSACIF